MKKLIITRGPDTLDKRVFVESKTKNEGYVAIYDRDVSREQKFVETLNELEEMIGNDVGKIIIHGENLFTKPTRTLAEKAMDYGYKFSFADFPVIKSDGGLSLDSSSGRFPVDYYDAYSSVLDKEYLDHLLSRFPYESWVTEEIVRGKYLSRSTPIDRERYRPYSNDRSLPPAILVDIDGTVAKNPIIDVANEPVPQREFSDYTENIMKDTPIQQVIDNVNFYHDNSVRLIFITGRDEISYDFNVKWFEKHGVKWDEMYCRGHHDYRNDWQVKDDFIRDHVEGKYHIMAVFDDRQQVVDHLRDMGLTVFQVAPGDF